MEFQQEEPYPRTIRHDSMQPVVQLEFCAEAETKAKELLKRTVVKPTAQKRSTSSKDRSKMVDAAEAYHFMIQNRCGNAANPLTFCPYCFTWWANSDHFSVHADVLDEQKLRAYVKGVFKSGLRGPLHRGSVVAEIMKYVRAGTLRNNIEQIFAVVGVGLTDSRTAAMPLYNMKHCFKKGVHPAMTQLHRTILDANTKMNESEVDENAETDDE